MAWTKYFNEAGEAPVAFVDDEGVAHLTEQTDILAAVDAGLRGLAVHRTAPVEELQLAPLVEDPPSIRDFMAFEEHVVTSAAARNIKVDKDWYRIPVFYFTNPAAATGPRTNVPMPPGTSQFDYELEVALVVGRGGSDIPIERAEEHIAGLMLMCDWSSRDIQLREMQQGLGPSKGKDSATSFGHLLVPLKELESVRTKDAFDVPLRAYVNDTLYSEGNLRTLYWSFAEILAHASVGTRLRRGDVIGTGTVGTGCIFELSAVHGSDRFPYLRPGDTVHLDGRQLGTIQAAVSPSSGRQLFPRNGF